MYQTSRQPNKQPSSKPFHSLSSNYFTQLSLITTVFIHHSQSLLTQYGIKISSILTNQQQDISKILFQYSRQQDKKSCSNNFMIEENYGENLDKTKLNICLTILQIQTSIKFHLIFTKIHMKSKTFEKSEQTDHNHQNQKQFMYIDEFWINYKNYIPKKIYQGYKIVDLLAQNNKQKFQKLKYIFNERILQQIIHVIQEEKTVTRKQDSQMINQNEQQARKKDKKLRQLFITAISNNYLKIHNYLQPKYYKNLKLCQRQLYKILQNQKNYKIIYENKWGLTGFDLQQKDWIKLYKNKVMGEWKKKPKHEQIQGFYY